MRFCHCGLLRAKQSICAHTGCSYAHALASGDRLEHRPNQLSGGQRQRVAIARALISPPTLLLADEPTGNLDSKTATGILDLMLNFNDEGQSILLVTHERDIAALVHRIIHMRDGKIEGVEVNP